MKKIASLVLICCAFLVSCEKAPLDLNVMTFNVRYDNPDDSLNNWQYRKDIVVQTITKHDVDILGTQEVLANQMQDLKDKLPAYTAIGVGREDGIDKGEYSALFYKTSKFNEIESGTFWLSETPDVAGSMGWDAACERVATWAFLEDMVTKKKIFAINTHLDHVGVQARINGVTLMLERAHTIAGDTPVLLTGDFNASPNSDVIQHVISEKTPNNLVNTQSIAKEKTDAIGTFHDFGKIKKEDREYIDYIFVSKGIEVLTYKAIEEKVNNIYLSDHLPICARVSIK